jgi:hypothetical protein
MASSAIVPPARAELIRSDAALAGKNFCWSSGSAFEQYGRDHSYVYSAPVSIEYAVQSVVHGTWSIGRDGVVTLKIEGGWTLYRRYDVNGDHVAELSGSLGGGAEGHVC